MYIVRCAQLRATLATPLYMVGGKERKYGLAIPCARATRGRGLPSLNARTMGTSQVATLIMERQMEIASVKLPSEA